MSVLGQVESCSSLARQKRSMESPDTAIHSVKASTLAKEPRPTLLCLPRLSAPAGNALVGSPREAPQGGLDTDLEMPIFQSALLNSCGKGAISSYKNWAGEPRNSALTTHCPLPRAARDTAGQSLMSWTEGHFSSCET